MKRAVAAQLQIPLVDLTDVIAPAGAEFYLDADPVHLNALGNGRIAETLLERLSPTGVVPAAPVP
jgi:lysophospholipase L1-like esterase